MSCTARSARFCQGPRGGTHSRRGRGRRDATLIGHGTSSSMVSGRRPSRRLSASGPTAILARAVGVDRGSVWPVVVAVQLGVLLAALDATIVGTAMPTVVATLGGVA